MMISDLNGIIREEMDRREVADPAAISVYVLSRIPAADLRSALALTLPFAVARVVRGRRNAKMRSIRGYRYELTLEEIAEREKVNQGLNRFGAMLLSLGDALNERVCVDGTWMFLRDCTVTGLRLLAEAHRALADQNLAKAEMYDALADQMEAAGRATVADLVAA